MKLLEEAGHTLIVPRAAAAFKACGKVLYLRFHNLRLHVAAGKVLANTYKLYIYI